VLQYILLAIAAGIAVGLGNYVMESLGFHLCRFLESKGQMKRFVPSTKGMFEDHPVTNIWAVGCPYIILYYIVARFLWATLWQKMYISISPLDIWPFLW
jgi:hypothetical protein